MALFDIPTSISYADHFVYREAQMHTYTPVQIVSGKTETTKTLKQITGYIGDHESFINELV